MQVRLAPVSLGCQPGGSPTVSESGDSEPFHQSQNSSSSSIPLGLEYPEPNPAYSARSYCPEATRPGPKAAKETRQTRAAGYKRQPGPKEQQDTLPATSVLDTPDVTYPRD